MYALLAALVLMNQPNMLQGGPFNNCTIKGDSSFIIIPRIVPFSPDRDQGTPTDDAGNTVVNDIYQKTNKFNSKGMRIYKFSGTEMK